MRNLCASVLFTLLLVIGATANAEVNSFPDAVSKMEAIVLPNTQATRDNPSLDALNDVLDFLRNKIPTGNRYYSAPSESVQPSPQSGPSVQVTPQNFAPAVEGRWVVQYRYEYQWVPRRGHLGKMHYECVLVCRPVWVFEQVPKSVPMYQTPQTPVMTILGDRLEELTAKADPRSSTTLSSQELWDLAIQIYSLTVTADDLFTAGRINRNSSNRTTPSSSVSPDTGQ